MKLIFIKNNLPLSILIRWGLKEPVSHFAIVFDEKIVFHSSLSGCNILWFNKYKKDVEVVYQLDYQLPLEIEEEIYQSIIDNNIGKGYDFKAFFYFIWCGILKRFFSKPFPTKNKWAANDQFICTGLAAALPENHFPGLNKIQDTEITSPYQLYLKLSHGQI